MRTRMGMVLSLVLAVCAAARAQAPSSSLYLQSPQPPVYRNGKIDNAALHAVSYVAVAQPEPRQFAVHDLVTIIVRESSTATSEATLETEKESKYSGEISDFPKLTLRDLVNLQLHPNDLSDDAPKLGVKFKNEFDGEGEYERKDELVTRITARVIDVKPNGTLALEARKHLRNDDETMTITLTGYCRAVDVAADNTVLSTQLYDLRLEKTHEGELRKSSSKGLLTRILDAIFNF